MSHDHGDTMPMTPGSSTSDGNMSMSTSDMMMHMTFYWGKDAIILFSGWPKDSLGMYILAFLLVLLLAVAIEVMSISTTAKLGTDNHLVVAFTQACVYAVRMGFAYVVMLAVMSYNLGILIAAVLGHSIGFFIVKARALATQNPANSSDLTPKV